MWCSYVIACGFGHLLQVLMPPKSAHELLNHKLTAAIEVAIGTDLPVIHLIRIIAAYSEPFVSTKAVYAVVGDRKFSPKYIAVNTAGGDEYWFVFGASGHRIDKAAIHTTGKWWGVVCGSTGICAAPSPSLRFHCKCADANCPLQAEVTINSV